MEKQKTIIKKVSLEGVGLHTGEQVKLEFLPAPAGSGILLVRKDLDPEVIIKADLYSLADPKNFPRRTSVGFNKVYVQTIEHLMASLSLLGIDNIQVNIWGSEIPGADGSAKDLLSLLQKAGINSQNAPRQALAIREPLWVQDNGSLIILLPDTEFRLSYTLKYDNPLIGAQFLDIKVAQGEVADIYQARTFCLQEEVDALIKMGLGKGANYENTLVVSDKGVVNNKLRYKDEFVRHKLLDLVGDLYLAGPLHARVIAIRSGHTLNIKLLQKLKAYKEKVSAAGVGPASKEPLPSGPEFNAEEIMKILPHRYPFLLVDRIKYINPTKEAVGIKNVTINDYFFQGHFPGKPVMPGVLIIEAMAQVGGVLMLAAEEHRGKLAYFMAADKVKFRKTVEPGDQLVIEVKAGKIKQKTGSVITKAFVDGKVAAEAVLMFALV